MDTRISTEDMKLRFRGFESWGLLVLFGPRGSFGWLASLAVEVEATAGEQRQWVRRWSQAMEAGRGGANNFNGLGFER